MRNLKSNLFKQFEVNKTDLSVLVGGSYTSVDSDTNMGNGANDVTTCKDLGGQTLIDAVVTNPAGETKDKPSQEVASNSFSVNCI